MNAISRESRVESREQEGAIPALDPRPSALGTVEALEARLLDLPQADIPLTHRFAPGVYMREVLMPAGTFVIGHQHKTEHLNIVMTGRARVIMVESPESRVESQTGSSPALDPRPSTLDIIAPYTFVSKPGVRKVLYILEDMRWATIHPTDETDLAKLEDLLIIKSNAFLDHEAMAALESLSIHNSQLTTHNSQLLCPG